MARYGLIALPKSTLSDSSSTLSLDTVSQLDVDDGLKLESINSSLGHVSKATDTDPSKIIPSTQSVSSSDYAPNWSFLRDIRDLSGVSSESYPLSVILDSSVDKIPKVQQTILDDQGNQKSKSQTMQAVLDSPLKLNELCGNLNMQTLSNAKYSQFNENTILEITGHCKKSSSGVDAQTNTDTDANFVLELPIRRTLDSADNTVAKVIPSVETTPTIPAKTANAHLLEDNSNDAKHNFSHMSPAMDIPCTNPAKIWSDEVDSTSNRTFQGTQSVFSSHLSVKDSSNFYKKEQVKKSLFSAKELKWLRDTDEQLIDQENCNESSQKEFGFSNFDFETIEVKRIKPRLAYHFATSKFQQPPIVTQQDPEPRSDAISAERQGILPHSQFPTGMSQSKAPHLPICKESSNQTEIAIAIDHFTQTNMGQYEDIATNTSRCAFQNAYTQYEPQLTKSNEIEQTTREAQTDIIQFSQNQLLIQLPGTPEFQDQILDWFYNAWAVRQDHISNTQKIDNL